MSTTTTAPEQLSDTELAASIEALRESRETTTGSQKGVITRSLKAMEREMERRTAPDNSEGEQPLSGESEQASDASAEQKGEGEPTGEETAEQKPKRQPKPKRPEPQEPTDFAEYEVVNAYHPTRHRDLSTAVVQRAFSKTDTYVKLTFDDDGQTVLTHKFNVFTLNGEIRRPPEPENTEDSADEASSDSAEQETAAAAS